LNKESVYDEFFEICLTEESVEICVHYSKCSIMIQSTIHIPLMNQGDNFVGPFEVIGFFFLGKKYFIIKRKFYLKFCLYRLSEHFLELFQINHTQPLLIHII